MINLKVNCTEQLLDMLVVLHKNELQENDFSIALGTVFIRWWYEELIKSPYSKLFVDIDDNKAKSVVCVFFNCSKFDKLYKKKYGFRIFLRCLSRPYLFISVVRKFLSSFFVKLTCPDSHLGMIIINSSVHRTPNLIKTFRLNVHKGFDDLRNFGHKKV